MTTTNSQPHIPHRSMPTNGLILVACACVLGAVVSCNATKRAGSRVETAVDRPHAAVVFASNWCDAFDQLQPLLGRHPLPSIIHIHVLPSEPVDIEYKETLSHLLEELGYNGEFQGQYGEYLPPYGAERVVCSMWMSSIVVDLVRYPVKDREIGAVIHWELERAGIDHIWESGSLGSEVYVGVQSDDAERALLALQQNQLVRARLSAGSLFLGSAPVE